MPTFPFLLKWVDWVCPNLDTYELVIWNYSNVHYLFTSQILKLIYFEVFHCYSLLLTWYNVLIGTCKNQTIVAWFNTTISQQQHYTMDSKQQWIVLPALKVFNSEHAHVWEIFIISIIDVNISMANKPHGNVILFYREMCPLEQHCLHIYCLDDTSGHICLNLTTLVILITCM